MLLALIVSEPEISIFPKGLVYMFCPPVVKLKSDKITLKRLSADATHATKRKCTILYKKILTMAIKTFRVHISTTAGTDIIAITPEIKRIAGEVLLFISGSTAALTTIEYESGAVADLRAALGRGKWIRQSASGLLSPSLAIPTGRRQAAAWHLATGCCLRF